MHFRSSYLIGIIVIRNRREQIKSSWKMNLWILLQREFINSIFQFFMSFLKFMILPDIMYIFRYSSIYINGTIESAICTLFVPWLNFFRLILAF